MTTYKPTIDPETFFRKSSLGLDALMDNLSLFSGSGGAFPFYNILRDSAGDKYILEMALAGYSKEDLTITIQDGILAIAGKGRKSAYNNELRYTLQSIKGGDFSRRFVIGDDLVVSSTKFVDGFLTIEFAVRKPPASKAITVSIG